MLAGATAIGGEPVAEHRAVEVLVGSPCCGEPARLRAGANKQRHSSPQVCRLQRPADLAHRHAARMNGHDPVVEPGKTPLVLAPMSCGETALSIARHLEGQPAGVGQHRLGTRRCDGCLCIPAWPVRAHSPGAGSSRREARFAPALQLESAAPPMGPPQRSSSCVAFMHSRSRRVGSTRPRRTRHTHSSPCV